MQFTPEHNLNEDINVRFFRYFAAFCLTIGSTGLATAQELEGVWAQYKIDIDSPVVEGAFLVAKVENGQVIRQGYSLKRISQFIAEDCASGKIGKIELGKQKQDRRRGETRVIQSFTTSCNGGIRADVRGTKYGTRAIVVKQANGQDKATYQFGRNGDMLTSTQVK